MRLRRMRIEVGHNKRPTSSRHLDRHGPLRLLQVQLQLHPLYMQLQLENNRKTGSLAPPDLAAEAFPALRADLMRLSRLSKLTLASCTHRMSNLLDAKTSIISHQAPTKVCALRDPMRNEFWQPLGLLLSFSRP